MFSFCSHHVEFSPGHGGETMAEPNPETPDPLDVALEQAVAICDGDVRAALRAEVERLTAEVERLTRAVSFGFLRKRLPARRASEKLDEWREISRRRHIAARGDADPRHRTSPAASSARPPAVATADICPLRHPLRALRSRTPVPTWARRAVGEGVSSCPRAGCGRSTSRGSMSGM